MPGPSPHHVPVPPAKLSPNVASWAAGTPLFRVYDVAGSPRDFHPGDPAHRGRFHPLVAGTGAQRMPVLYGADDLDGALSETVFHDVPVRGTKVVPWAKLRHKIAIRLMCRRGLALVDLTGYGLLRIGVSRAELIDSDARSYPTTAPWAQALHAQAPRADGLLWVSRQHDTSRCLMLFGDRVGMDDLYVPEDEIPLPLAVGAGLAAVASAALRADITITGLV